VPDYVLAFIIGHFDFSHSSHLFFTYTVGLAFLQLLVELLELTL